MPRSVRLAVSALALLAATPALAEPATITFLHVNDVYEIAPDPDEGGGFAPLMTLLKGERAKNPNTITTFGGDLISPSILSGLTKGAQMVDLLNAVGVDVAVLGNHEFDFGPEVADERVVASQFPWLAANVVDGKTGEPAAGTAGTRLVTMGGYKVGFVGLLTPETEELSSPGPAISILDPIETAAKSVARLKERGADFVVALTHMPLAEDRRLLREVEDVDLVLGGHDHDPITWYESDGLIVKAGHDAHYLAALDVTLDRVEGDDGPEIVWHPAWRYEATKGVAPDPEVGKTVAGYQEKLDEELATPVGETLVELDTRRGTVRGKESNFGDFIADAIRNATGAEVAIMNGGGIRGDRTYAPGTVLTRKEILGELPFGNVTVLIELKGADLRAALENGVSQVEEAAGRFPQVSGMSYSYDPKKPAGQRIVEVRVGGQPLDPTRAYKVATNDYIQGGGDGYTALTAGKPLIDASGGTLMATTVMNYATAQGGKIAPAVEGRIVRLD
ncbi:MAG: 5'-nucleotidase C-terminal domain-containing protein [Geminicoccaceae bacterium]|nr:5'-nucleotidase C-terminal domain-containing protein [Geminicoccaceae bacterium]